MNSKLYVGNLPFSTTAQHVQELFAQVGAVESVDLIYDKFTGRSRGFAFVTMGKAEDARQAVEQLHGSSIDGRAITVNEARPPETRPTRSFAGTEERRGGHGGGSGRPFDRERDRRGGYRD